MIHGAVNDRGTWQIDITQNYTKDPDIIKFMESNWIRCKGHLFRTDDSNSGKKVIFGDPLYAKKKIGRPSVRWLADGELSQSNWTKRMER